MKTLLTATAATALLTGAAFADAHSGPIKMGIILGVPGPLETITPHMGDAAEMAIAEVNEAGGILEGRMVEAVRGDSTCIDAGAATAAAERLVTSEGVTAIMGADCSGVTGAILSNVAVPNGAVMISPSATPPGPSTAEDNGLFFRTAPSDARQGTVMTEVLMDRGFNNVALTYTNNDYGKGLADAFQAAFEEAGGTVTISTAHEDGKADYSAEVAELDAAGGDILVVAGYVDQGGLGIIQSSLDAGSFEQFVLPDGMFGQSLIENIGDGLNGSFGQVPGTDSEGAAAFIELGNGAGFDATSSFTAESYDAAALLMLAMEASGSTAGADIAGKVMELANAPGEQIFPGELAKALEIIRGGGDIDYVGASAVELIGPGESAGNYREYDITDGEVVTTGFR